MSKLLLFPAVLKAQFDEDNAIITLNAQENLVDPDKTCQPYHPPLAAQWPEHKSLVTRSFY
jgi:hypothetical protein